MGENFGNYDAIDVAIQRFHNEHIHKQPQILRAPGDRLWCFFFSVQRVFAARGFSVPELGQLYKIFRSIARNFAVGFGMENTSNIRVDQGAMIIFELGKQYGLGVLQLGIWRPQEPGRRLHTDPHVVLYDFPDSDITVPDHTIWLRHSGNPESGHYDGLAPIGTEVRPEEAERLACMASAPRSQLGDMVDRIRAIDNAMKAREMSIVDVHDTNLRTLARLTIQEIWRVIKMASPTDLATEDLSLAISRRTFTWV